MNESITKPYYIFLNIDGTLWDLKFLRKKYGFYADINNFKYPDLKTESIEAVNLLLKSLETKFDTKLVITSNRRRNMNHCVQYLLENGLEYEKPIFSIKYPSEATKGNDIVDFMKSSGENPLEYANNSSKISKFFSSIFSKDFENYVVLEDEKKTIQDSIPNNRIIFSNNQKKSITKKQVEKYLNSINIEPQIEQPEVPEQE